MKITVVGAGNVGATCADACARWELGNEVVLLDIKEGFAEAGLDTCGFCETGKILVTAALLERRARPAPAEILDAMASVPCRCTDPEAIVKAVQAAADRRARRLYHRAGQ